MILCVSSKKVGQLSFVKDYIENHEDTKSKEEEEVNDDNSGDDVVVTQGRDKEKEKQKEEKEPEKEDNLQTQILKMKSTIDESLFKMMIYQVGCFIDLYYMIKNGREDHGSIVAKFISYFYFFKNKRETRSRPERKNSSSLLSMKHGINGDNLLGIAQESNGNLLYQALSKYIESNEAFNEKFREYGKYFNEMISLIKATTTQVLFCFFLCCFVV